GGNTATSGLSGGASVAPASSAFFLRVRARSAQDWRLLARLFPRAAAMVGPLRSGLGPETDVVALGGGTFLGLTQPPDEAKLDALLAGHRPRLVAEQVGDWRVIARSRGAIDRLKRARNDGSLADGDAYRQATRGLPAAALATVYADGSAVRRGLRERGAPAGAVPGLGRVDWTAGALTRRPGGLGVELRVNGDRVEAATYTAELPAQIPAPVMLLVDAKGLDRTIEELRRSPALAASRNPLVQALRTGVLDDAVGLFGNEAAFYVRQLPGGPESTLIVEVDDEVAADAIVDRLVTLAAAVTQNVPAHETIAGADATRLTLGKTTVYYAVFDGKLVATTAPSGIRGIRRPGGRFEAARADGRTGIRGRAACAPARRPPARRHERAERAAARARARVRDRRRVGARRPRLRGAPVAFPAVPERSFLFTSESVTEGHPDKMADQISDSVLDAVLTGDPENARVACETLITTGLVVVAGEITTEVYVDIRDVVRRKVREIGYDRAKYGFDAETC